jgi:hypothetical protein
MLAVQTTIALVSLAFFVPQAIVVPLLQRAANRRAKRKVRLVRELGELLVIPPDDRGPATGTVWTGSTASACSTTRSSS